MDYCFARHINIIMFVIIWIIVIYKISGWDSENWINKLLKIIDSVN